MKQFAFRIAIAAAASTAMFSSAPATAAPPEGGTIAIEPKTADGEYDPSLTTFTAAAGEALASKGFTILDDEAHAAWIAELVLTRVDVGTGTAKGTGRASSVTGGAAGTGVGVAIPLGTGQSRLVALQRIQVEMRIHKRGDGAIVWHAAAMTVRAAGTRKGGDDVVATTLGGALLSAYPGQPTEIIGVP